MATTVHDPHVGQLIYEGFKPQNPGIIREILRPYLLNGEPFAGWMYVRVEWLKPRNGRKIEEVCTKGMKDFSALIADHLRKYEAQKKMAEALYNMPEDYSEKGLLKCE